MSGRKPTIINLIATSPEGEVMNFKTMKEAAEGLGFDRSSILRAYKTKRNWIGDYNLEWLEVEDKSSEETIKEIIEKRKQSIPKKEKKYRTIAAKVKDEEKEKQE